LANCTKCRHAKEIDRLRKICLGCAIGKDSCGLSNGGVSFVSFDAARDENCKQRIARRGVVREDVQIVETPLGGKERENLLRVIYMFSSLSYDEAGMVCRMMQGRTIQQIADERSQSIQTVHARWKSIVKRDPAWQAIMNGMIGSGRGRKPDPKPMQQLTLFDLMGGGNGQT